MVFTYSTTALLYKIHEKKIKSRWTNTFKLETGYVIHGKKIALRWTATCTLEASYAAHKERTSQDEKLFSIHFLLVSLLD